MNLVEVKIRASEIPELKALYVAVHRVLSERLFHGEPSIRAWNDLVDAHDALCTDDPDDFSPPDPGERFADDEVREAVAAYHEVEMEARCAGSTDSDDADPGQSRTPDSPPEASPRAETPSRSPDTSSRRSAESAASWPPGPPPEQRKPRPQPDGGQTYA